MKQLKKKSVKKKVIEINYDDFLYLYDMVQDSDEYRSMASAVKEVVKFHKEHSIVSAVSPSEESGR